MKAVRESYQVRNERNRKKRKGSYRNYMSEILNQMKSEKTVVGRIESQHINMKSLYKH